MRALSPTILSRRDTSTARLIDLAVQAQQSEGTPAAASMPAGASVAVEIAARVLTKPRERRGCVKRTIAHTQ